MMNNVDNLHTTELGVERVRRNLGLGDVDIIAWCKRAVLAAGKAAVIRKGKNWYVQYQGCVITINAHSDTIITAHKIA